MSTVLAEVMSKLEVDLVGIVQLAQWQGTKLEENAKKLLPQARSVVVLAMEIYPEVLDLTSVGRVTGAASLYDLFDRHAEYISGRLTRAAYDVAKASRRAGRKALPLPAVGCPFDMRFLEAIFSFKHAAEAAGLGKLGWHSLLTTPDFGPRVRLACCLTEAALEPTKGNMVLECDSCSLCLDSCPAKALARPQAGELYVINKFACSAFRTAAGGCAECMRVCPVGK